jgi:mannose-6-phosphate isomerase-like protein (cupin superfamily)
VKRKFVDTSQAVIATRHGEHGGNGPVYCSRLLTSTDFDARVDFVDHTVIPAGSTIGLHEHRGNEEFYFLLRGAPRIRVDGHEVRASPGMIALVRSGQSHELVNDTDEEVEILVVQIPL